MSLMKIEKQINAPVERVFAVMTDLSSTAKRISGIKKMEVLTPGPFGKGTRFRETRMMFGKEATETMEITDFQAGKSYTACANSCGSLMSTTIRCAPNGSGTRLEFVIDCRPLSLLAKILSPLGMLMMGGMMKRMVEKDLDDLKAAIESGSY